MNCGYALWRTCVDALLAVREVGEDDIRHFSTKRFSTNLMDRMSDPNKFQSGDYPFFKFFGRTRAEQCVSSDSENIHARFMRSSSDISSSRREETASTSGIYSEVSGEELISNNDSLLSLQPWIFKRVKCSTRVEEDCDDASGRWCFDWGASWRTSNSSPRRINRGGYHILFKKRQQDAYIVGPVNSAQNIFMPHLCREKFEDDEYSVSSLHSSQQNDGSSSFLVTRNRETSRLRVDSLVEQPENGEDKQIGHVIGSEKKLHFDEKGDSVNGELRTLIGVPDLPPQILRKEERKSEEAVPQTLDTSRFQKSRKICDLLGSHDGMLLFFLGVSIGVSSSILSNKFEVEKLNNLLKDNKKLVKDLHEELEMKNSLIVNELGNETNENKEIQQYDHEIFIHDTALKMDGCDEARMRVIPEALSEIEAELEAELERLEQNINGYGVGQRASGLLELDSELIAEVVQGELREDLLVNGGREFLTSDDEDACASTATRPYNANYSVSPKELSLRLHEVIENRLEKRIKELESTLEQSEMKLKLIEVESSCSKPPFSISIAGSSSQDSPKSLKQNEPIRGNEQVSFDDAYEEFIRLAETEDVKLPSSNSAKDELFSRDGDLLKKEDAWEPIVWRTGSYDISGMDYDDGEDDSFDEGKDLIQKLVEKTKGSPALLNAQRMFFMMDL